MGESNTTGNRAGGHILRGEMKDTLLEKRRLLQLLEERKPNGRCLGPLLNISNRLDVRKSFFTVREVGYWNRLPKEIFDAPCPSVLKRHLYNAFSSML